MKIRSIIFDALLVNKFSYRIIQLYFNKILPFFIDLRLRINYHLRKKGYKSHEKNKISQLIFEPTNICNAKCVFCIYRKIENPKFIMSFDLYKKGIDEFILLGGETIYLTPTVGEAFLDKGLFDKINYAKSNGLIVKMHTNGILLNVGKNFEKIVDSNIDELLISIGDIESKSESQIFGINEELSKQKIAGIKNLIRYNNKQLGIKKIILNFRSLRTPKEILNDDDFKKLLSEPRGFELVIDFLLGYDNWGGKISQEDLIGEMRIKKQINFRKYPCIRLFNTIVILSNGDLRACGCIISDEKHDELIIGNINSNSIEELLNGDKLRKLRKGFENNMMPNLCKKCSYYEPCILFKI